MLSLCACSQYVLAAAIVGVITGFVVAGFERLTVDVVFDRIVADLPLVVLAFLPGVGLAVAALWLWGPGRKLSPSTADEYLDAFHEGRQLFLRDLAHRLVAAIATLGSGCALGLEGPSIYLGSALGSASQRRFRRLLVGADRNLLLVAGAAAGIAAIFKAPATGAVFALEVPYQDDLARRMLLPALVAAASGYVVLGGGERHCSVVPDQRGAAVVVRRPCDRGRARCDRGLGCTDVRVDAAPSEDHQRPGSSRRESARRVARSWHCSRSAGA